MICRGYFRLSRSLFLFVFLIGIGCASGPPESGTSAPGGPQFPEAAEAEPEQEANPAVAAQDARDEPGDQEQQVDDRPGVGVWPFSNGGSFGPDPWDYEAFGIGLQQMLITELALNSGLRLVERSRLREIIDELELGQSGFVDSNTSARVGSLVQARYMIVGGFVDANGTMRLDARIDDVETGEILVETASRVQGDREDILDMVIQLAMELTEAADLPSLPDQVVDERKALDYPSEAIRLYSRALRREERGDLDGMVELLRQLTTDFPQHIEGRQMLEQYGVSDRPRPGQSGSRSEARPVGRAL